MTLRRDLPLLLLALVASPLPLPAETRLAAAGLDDSVLVFEARPEGATWPELVVPGTEPAARELSLRRRWVRSATGTWSAAGQLPQTLAGAPFQHGHRPWLARLKEHGTLGPIVEVGPLSQGGGVDHSAIARHPSATAVLVTAPDPWHFRIVEGLDDGTLLVSEHTSHGPLRQVELSDSFRGRPDWPGGTRLVGAAGPPGEPLLFGRDPEGPLRAGRPGVNAWMPLPDLELDPALAAVGLEAGGAPAAVVAGGGRLTLWRLAGIAWERHGSVEVGDASGSWTALGGEPVLALRLADDRLDAWRWSEGTWTPEVVPTGEESALVSPPPLEPSSPAPRSTGPRAWLPTVLLAVAGALAVALVLVVSRRRPAA